MIPKFLYCVQTNAKYKHLLGPHSCKTQRLIWEKKNNSKALLLSPQFIWQTIVTCSRITVITETAFRQAT